MFSGTTSAQKILIIDDDRSVRLVLSTLLKKNGFVPVQASGGQEGIAALKNERPQCILLDLKMPGMDGIETLYALKKTDQFVPVIIVTGYADIPTAVQTIKLGAYDFLTKPPQVDKLILTIKRAVETYSLQVALNQLDDTMLGSLESLFGRSDAIKNVIHQIRQVAGTDFSVIIQGETGTGKSLVAQTIHDLSKRARNPFQSVDVGVIPENLIESELFGHGKGAFTGADRKRIGFFEIAHKGTLFIDELENTPPLLQNKLLRAVEEKRIYPIGSTKPVDVDVRIIAASNADIKKAVREKRFREDLFFRLSEYMITMPRLRDRPSDIPFLAMKLMTAASMELEKQMRELSPEAAELLMAYSWPGNIRELKNVIRRAVLACDDGIIRPEHIEFIVGDTAAHQDDNSFLMPLKQVALTATRDAEREVIKRALTITGGNKSRAAKLLEIDYKTLLTKIRDYKITASR
ncbi:MAG: sigma-54 dependent transcriptional regulator [Syntrophorhabdaceae bacterium]|nr:sigma-54 dependent transcriptional regulator [Syntrophorhabdaceae bacterium]